MIIAWFILLDYWFLCDHALAR